MKTELTKARNKEFLGHAATLYYPLVISTSMITGVENLHIPLVPALALVIGVGGTALAAIAKREDMYKSAKQLREGLDQNEFINARMKEREVAIQALGFTPVMLTASFAFAKLGVPGVVSAALIFSAGYALRESFRHFGLAREYTQRLARHS